MKRWWNKWRKGAAPRRPSRDESRPSFPVLLLLGIFPLLLLHLTSPPVITTFEAAASDAQMRLRNAIAPRQLSDSISIVGVDDVDEELLDEDLKSRQSYMELLARLRKDGARVAAFDIFFVAQQPADDLFALALSDRALPTVLAYNFKSAGVDAEPEGEMPADLQPLSEQALRGTDASSLRRSALALDDYILQLRSFEREERSRAQPDEQSLQATRQTAAWARYLRNQLLKRWFVLTDGRSQDGGALGRPFRAREIRLLSPLLLMAPSARGFANVEKGHEDIVRKVPLVYEYQEHLFPSLGLATALQYHGVSFSDVSIRWGESIEYTPRQNGGGPIRIPIDTQGLYRVNFREGESFLQRNPTLTGVLASSDASALFGEGYFRDKVVFIGEVISGGLATDVEPIPLQANFPMVGLHANTLDNILRQDFLYDPPRGAAALMLMLLGAAAAALFYFFPFGRASQLTLLLAVLYYLTQFLLFQTQGLILPVVKPGLGLLAATLLFFGYVIVIKDRDRRMVRDVFLKSVSPRIGEEILKNFHDAAIWGARREITVLFIDVRGYTTLSEQHGPEVVLDILDQFYDTVSEAVFRHDGQVNKFMGDAVLALFGALPEETPDHGLRAVKAAAEIQLAMARLNKEQVEPRFGLHIDTGAGVNTGEATVGLVGRRRIRIEYTALGDAVNVASRLQGLASERELIVSARTVEKAGEEAILTALRELGLGPMTHEQVHVKGKRDAIPIYRVALQASPQPHTSSDIPAGSKA